MAHTYLQYILTLGYKQILSTVYTYLCGIYSLSPVLDYRGILQKMGHVTLNVTSFQALVFEAPELLLVITPARYKKHTYKATINSINKIYMELV
jgi:hypothetical protein